MRAIANHLNTLANTAEEHGNLSRARFLYKLATLAAPSWSVPHYNLGLLEKNDGNWCDSLAHNQRAAVLDPDDEATWWNLAIAATALRNWPEALRAWHAVGIDSAELRDGQITMPPTTACVRLDPNGEFPEVVWGTRLDAARIQIENVPLPRSRRRYRDILLNDGAPTGERSIGDQTYPVFDELALWLPSAYSTFTVTLRSPSQDARQHLSALCEQNDIALEDRGNLRLLCDACSRGNPGEHLCTANPDISGSGNFGVASTDQATILAVLHQWTAAHEGSAFTPPQLELTPA